MNKEYAIVGLMILICIPFVIRLVIETIYDWKQLNQDWKRSRGEL